MEGEDFIQPGQQQSNFYELKSHLPAGSADCGYVFLELRELTSCVRPHGSSVAYGAPIKVSEHFTVLWKNRGVR
jgi:hypothetical protein